MKRILAAVAVSLVLFTACGPSEAEKECKANGGRWKREFSHMEMRYNAAIKISTMEPVYVHRCDW